MDIVELDVQRDNLAWLMGAAAAEEKSDHIRNIIQFRKQNKCRKTGTLLHIQLYTSTSAARTPNVFLS